MEDNTKENKVSWNNIFILEEFLAYLSAYQLKEFSLLSRFVRNKLNHKLFFEITLSNKNIIKKFNTTTLMDKELSKISNYFEYWNSQCYYYRINDKWEEQLSNSSSLLVLNKLLEDELKNVGKFVKNFNVSGFYYSFYFLNHIVIDLINLTQLNLKECAFPLLMMLKIGEHLKKLKILNLKSVYLIALSKQELSLEDVYLPLSLEELSIDCCKVYNICSAPNTLFLARHKWNNVQYNLIRLPGFNIPNLKKLSLAFMRDSVFVLKLLKLNPQVEELIIEGIDMTQDVSDLISITDKITNITIYSEESFPYILNDISQNIPYFNYIKYLKLHIFYTANPEVCHSHSIMEYFPNLTQLVIDIRDFVFEELNLNEFIRVNLSSVYRLDKLTLEMKGSDSVYHELYNSRFKKFKFDWFNFINVNCLIFDIDLLSISAIDFDALPNDIKEIRVPYIDKNYILNYIDNNINIFQKWNTEFKKGVLQFTK
ncbi:hypothetical protein CONCODRAFT_13892 [Conidiobolus coronatus NRRL 28638]|uniref:F-box domain-containing protein n=1 Tax=Conidiobolus coronatus (strain ATCC 28846 / CBS 209.66 / NRRL 28638) TaxID=796925 RepID=A0A137NPZ8_CONC2|nr:hypothetical protein CONCODRAFT_13892 [Conidiobolus coronatus NRRL 28638]|eukprot:KXN64811.1 hypothetical protein CONCODRAFT_13892 [Conidiobolus coronatus NRRL 28638]